MKLIKIDGVEYDLESLDTDALTQIKNMQFVDSEIQYLSSRIAVLNAARQRYASLLKDSLNKKANT